MVGEKRQNYYIVAGGVMHPRACGGGGKGGCRITSLTIPKKWIAVVLYHVNGRKIYTHSCNGGCGSLVGYLGYLHYPYSSYLQDQRFSQPLLVRPT